MLIKVSYTDRVELFDTNSLNTSDPFGKAGEPVVFGDVSMELNPQKVEAEGLYATVNYYVAEADKMQEPGDDAPEAARKRGVRVLIADEVEVAQVNSVSMDGELLLQRHEDSLCNVHAFNEAYRALLGTPSGVLRDDLVLYTERSLMINGENWDLVIPGIPVHIAELAYNRYVNAREQDSAAAGDDAEAVEPPQDDGSDLGGFEPDEFDLDPESEGIDGFASSEPPEEEEIPF